MSPYIEHERERIYFVPVLRQRLNFAVLLRKALAALAWSKRDLIAVALPPSVLTSICATLTETPGAVLPVSLVISDWDDSQYREVFPITPCDGLIEAIRFATERQLPVEAIDREIMPGNLLQRRCLKNPEWPDDDLVLRWGPERYFDLVVDEMAQPPTRFEPIDTWRETGIAARIQTLAPKYHRVLVVCEGVHLAAVRRRLGTPYRRLADGIPSGTPRLRVLRANAETALQYLDDFPKLAELYEQARAAGTADNFEKSTAVLHAVRANTNANILGSRRFQSFHRFLLQLLEKANRTSPRPYELQQAALSCFGTAAAQEIVHKLGGYGDQIAFERVGEVLPDRTPVFEVKESNPGPAELFVGRSCNLNRPQYTIRPRPPAWKGRNSDRERQNLRDSMRAQARQKIILLATRCESESKSTPFRGTLEAGIDKRRTLRSMLSRSPKLYVRQIKRRPKPRDLTHEPIVWIFSATVKAGHSLKCIVVREEDEEIGYPQYSSYQGNEQELYTSDDGLIKFIKAERLGFLSFFDEDDVSELRKKLGTSFDLRVINHETQMDPLHECGCILKDLDYLSASNAPWWEILLLTALRVAAETVICVVPDGFRLPSRFVTEARERNKQVVCLRATSVSAAERERLGKLYSVEAPRESLKDKSVLKRIYQIADQLGIEY